MDEDNQNNIAKRFLHNYRQALAIGFSVLLALLVIAFILAKHFINLAAAAGLLVILIVGLAAVSIFLLLRSQKTKEQAESISAALKAAERAKESAEEALQRMAFYDELTGIANRNLLSRSVKGLLSNEENTYAYVVLDVRKFKVINDLFGYALGDLLLRHIGQTIISLISDKETVARFSADNFHLLLIYEGEALLEQRLNALAEQICGFDFLTDSSYHISIQFGVYVVENAEEPVQQMGDRANLALGSIKAGHTTSIFFYDDSIRNHIMEEQWIENDMQRSVDNGDFVIFLQPKYSPAAKKLEGAEALVRWQHSEQGLIPPDLFIPLFEKNGFITTLDLYVLESVCKTIRRWLDAGRGVVPVSVNQSRLLLYGTDYVAKVMGLMNKYKIPHELIELEVTESVFFEDSLRMVSIMKEIHSYGVTISMDDFGSGYSSLNMLKDIMVDTLKIDRDFFSESADNERGRKIVTNIISLARDLKIKVVAEGVETQEQVDFLRTVGCDLVQGFYFSKPVPVSEFEKLL